MLRNPNGPRRYWKAAIANKSRCCDTVVNWVFVAYTPEQLQRPNPGPSDILQSWGWSPQRWKLPHEGRLGQAAAKDYERKGCKKMKYMYVLKKNFLRMKKKHSHSYILRGEFCTVLIWDKFGIYHLGCGLEVSGEDAQIEAILTSCHSACAHVRVLQNIKEYAKMRPGCK